MGTGGEKQLDVALNVCEWSMQARGPGSNQQLHGRHLWLCFEDSAERLPTPPAHTIAFDRGFVQF